MCDGSITVHMPGGKLQITIDPEGSIEMVGPVTRIAEGRIDPDALEESHGQG